MCSVNIDGYEKIVISSNVKENLQPRLWIPNLFENYLLQSTSAIKVANEDIYYINRKSKKLFQRDIIEAFNV